MRLRATSRGAIIGLVLAICLLWVCLNHAGTSDAEFRSGDAGLIYGPVFCLAVAVVPCAVAIGFLADVLRALRRGRAHIR